MPAMSCLEQHVPPVLLVVREYASQAAEAA